MDRSKHREFRLAVEPIAGLHLGGCRAVLEHPAEVPLQGRHELRLASGACGPDGGEYASAGSMYLLIRGPPGAQLELLHPVPEESCVGVAIHEPWECHLAPPVDRLAPWSRREAP